MIAARIAISVVALALADCDGSDRYAYERERVEKLMPDAEGVSCSGDPRRNVECEGTLHGNPMFCEFRVDGGGDAAYSGTESCWSEPRRRRQPLLRRRTSTSAG